MIEKLKSLFDDDMKKVLLATVAGFTANMAALDSVLKVMISLMTIFYIGLKTVQWFRHHKKG